MFWPIIMSRLISVLNLSHPISSPAKIKYCDSFFCRLRGLTFLKHLNPDEGLLLVQGVDSRLNSSIHMLFVSFELNVVWINSQLIVVDRTIAKPWRPVYLSAKPACYILEIHPDRWEDYQVGDRVEIKNV